MEDLLQLQLLARQQRTPYAVATIVEATGSTPRTEGKMLVYADGRSAGTIGGGLAELRAKKDAADARKAQRRLERMKAEAAEIEAEIETIDAEMTGSASTDYVRLAELDTRKTGLEEHLLTLYEAIEES